MEPVRFRTVLRALPVAVLVAYWPGLRTGDSYSPTRQSGTGFAVNNASGVAQLRWGWGL